MKGKYCKYCVVSKMISRSICQKDLGQTQLGVVSDDFII